MLWRNLKIKWKLGVGFAVVLGCLAGLSVLSWNCVVGVQGQLQKLRDESSTLALKGKDLQFHTVQVQQWLTDISATRGKEGFDDGFDEAEAHANEFKQLLEDFRTAFRANSDKESLEATDTLEASFDGFYAMGKQMAEVYIAEGPDAGNQMMEEFDPYAEAITVTLGEFVEQQTSDLHNTIAGTTSELDALMLKGAVITVVGVCISLAMIWLTTVSITSPLKKAVEFAHLIASGDLSERVQIDQADEIGELGESLNTMTASLLGIVQSVASKATMLADASNSLSVTATNLVSGATDSTSTGVSDDYGWEVANYDNSRQQKASADIKSIAGAVREMAERISDVSVKCDQASLMASDATHLAEASSQNIGRLDIAANEIGTVIDTIQGIAKQTNLLALNATIEAVRAGEAGKGFVVVANEVKELARQTAEATEDIRQRIMEIQGTTGIATDSIRRIVDVIVEVSDVSSTIACSVDRKTTMDFSETMNGVDQAIQRTSDGAEEARAASGELSSVAIELQDLVGQFTLSS